MKQIKTLRYIKKMECENWKQNIDIEYSNPRENIF